MRIYKYLTGAAILSSLTLLPLASTAQESSLNSYSPYTMYGLGDLNRSPISAFAGMGGASIGFRNGGFDTTGEIKLNVSNPASLSGLAPRSFIFDVGMAGKNVYLRQQNRTAGLLRTSYNTFNFNNISFALPLARRLGFAFSVSPYSEVGYRISTYDESYLADLGPVHYYYYGQGDITEAKAAVGWEPFKNFSVGVEMNYLWGNIDRTYQAEIKSFTGTGSYNSVSANTNERVARVFAAFGAQYTPLDRAKTRLTLGLTYRLGGKLNSDVTDYIPSNNIYGDVIRLNEFKSATYIPQRIGAGVYFHRPKWAVGVDYILENWGARNDYDALNELRYVNANTFKLGVRYTPDRYDLRGKFGSFFRRMTYMAGFRTGADYIELRGVPMNDRAFTLGVDIPFRADKISALSVGLELGGRGSLEYGTQGSYQQSLVKERYFKINVGVMLFGRDYDYWFEKYRYN